MRNIALLGSVVVGANSVPRLFVQKPPNINKQLFSCYLLSLQHPSSKNYSSKLFLRNPSSVFSRHSSQWSANTFGRFLQTSEKSDGHESLRCLDLKNFGEIAELIENMDEYDAKIKALAEKNLKKKSEKTIDFLFADNLVGHYLNFMLLFGFLALQGTQPAVAASGFASGLLSSPYFADLGDISTGFASAFLLIFFSELGDKTFFIAALLAARNSAAVVFTGTFGALAAMTIISVALGRTFHYVDEILPFRGVNGFDEGFKILNRTPSLIPPT
ncbi:GDT1-like protein 1 [Morus notabilis]|uniref:GDT1 family protein n=1 Tax=Morus notabilis TaxID=981085 RepID=W9S2J9_9ROSA|nr:GDT1-like protein 1 [Morus notabilis]